MSRIDMTGLRFGKLVVIEPVGKNNHKSLMWRCVCDCGNERIVDGSGIRAGRNKSCGCSSPKFSGDIRTHGLTGTRLYGIWVGMKVRCSDKAEGRTRKNYYDKGIRVCDRWMDIRNFLEDMGHPPDNLSIDRIDNSKGYEPGNCRWADSKTQGNNTSSNHVININGEKRTISQWSEITGAKANTIVCRVKRGWDMGKAIQVNPISKAEEKRLARIKNCLFCGNKFIPRNSQLKVGQGKYCSHKCSFSNLQINSVGRIVRSK